MKLEAFDEWFAIRMNYQEQENDPWPGRLVFDPADGFYLTTAHFTSGRVGDAPPDCKSTITGWLDYQRPTTLVNPWIQAVESCTFSVDTPRIRELYRFVVNAVLKNIFLEDISDPIFTGLIVGDAAINAWICPRLLAHHWETNEKPLPPKLAVGVETPQHRSFTLSNGTEVTLTSTARPKREQSFTVDEHSVLRLQFPEPVNYDVIMRLVWRISSVFSFLIGADLGAPVYQLPTTHAREWNGEKRQVTAELWYTPSKHASYTPPPIYDRLMVEGSSSLTLPQVLELLLGKQDELIYLANVIQAVENSDLSITQGFGEILGCLEKFDTMQFGSGASADFKPRMDHLEKVVRKHGSEDDQALFQRMRGGTRNSYSLMRRLDRLHQHWHNDGFRGSPDLSRMRDIRNLIPHGRGLEVSSDVAREMATFNRYLSALGRYHVLRALGCTADEIANAFSMQIHRYGIFIPKPSSGV